MEYPNEYVEWITKIKHHNNTIIEALDQLEGATVNQLVEHTKMKHRNVYYTLKRLDKKGYIERKKIKPAPKVKMQWQYKLKFLPSLEFFSEAFVKRGRIRNLE